MRVKAAILAGGKGTRFKPITDFVAKPLIPIGEKERPLLEHIIVWISRHGIREIILLIGHHGHQIMNYFADGDRWNIIIKYSEDDGVYTNTGGALLGTYRKGLIEKSDTVLVWYGDILARINVRDLLEKHASSGASATVAVAEKYKLPVGVAEVDSDLNIVRLIEKPWYPVNVTIGVLALEARILEEAEESLGSSFDIMGDLIPFLIEKGYTVKAYIYRGPWYDVGSIERYVKLGPERLRKELGDFIL